MNGATIIRDKAEPAESPYDMSLASHYFEKNNIRGGMTNELGVALSKAGAWISGAAVAILPFVENGIRFIDDHHLAAGFFLGVASLYFQRKFDARREVIYREELRRSLRENPHDDRADNG